MKEKFWKIEPQEMAVSALKTENIVSSCCEACGGIGPECCEECRLNDLFTEDK